MSVEVDIRMPNLLDLVGRLQAFRQDQLPFALSLAMNRAAKDARDQVRPLMERAFWLKSKTLPRLVGPFGRFGGGKATKKKSSDARAAGAIANGWSHRTQWPNLRVVFGSPAHAVELQERGGTKPRKSPAVWIPTKHVLRKSTGRKVNRHRKSVLTARLEGADTGRKQKGNYRVFMRRGVVFERDRNAGVTRPLYLIRSRATVPPILGLEELIRDTYNAKLWPRFAQAMNQAMTQAKSSNRYTGRNLI